MRPSELAFVRVEPGPEGSKASLSMEALVSLPKDPEILLRTAVDVYMRHLEALRQMLSAMRSLRERRQLLPARNMWRFGDAVFRLRDALARESLQLDGLYAHLTRDLGVKRKWLEKAVIFRRYVPRQSLIPLALNWGQCEKGTRRIAEQLSRRCTPRKSASGNSRPR